MNLIVLSLHEVHSDYHSPPLVLPVGGVVVRFAQIDPDDVAYKHGARSFVWFLGQPSHQPTDGVPVTETYEEIANYMDARRVSSE